MPIIISKKPKEKAVEKEKEKEVKPPKQKRLPPADFKVIDITLIWKTEVIFFFLILYVLKVLEICHVHISFVS